jgi:hypothetical protein
MWWRNGKIDYMINLFLEWAELYPIRGKVNRGIYPWAFYLSGGGRQGLALDIWHFWPKPKNKTSGRILDIP